ncbi:MAG TPA: ATP-binding protein, partial [Kofleriaceae bacterium]|nr:ATP-binding protein [Kofleriaceae bacterium]
MAADRRRRIMRFFGPRTDLLAAEAPGLVVYDTAGHVRLRAEIGEFLDVAPVGDELWVMTPAHLVRLAARTGHELGREPIGYLDRGGRFLLSSTAPHLPVWHAAQPVVLRRPPLRGEVPGPGSDVILPVSDGRWLLWQAGQLRLWRSLGDAWRARVPAIGEPGGRTYDAQLVLDGRLFVLVQAHRADGDVRIAVSAVSDGAPHTQLRLSGVTQLAIAARRGVAVARAGDRLSLIDLRFGRWLRDLALPAGVTELAVDDSLSWLALAHADGLELVRPDALATPGVAPSDDGGDAAPAPPPEPPPIVVDEPVAAAEPPPVAPEATAEATQAALDELPDEPLVRLDPVSVTADATPDEIARSIALRLDLIGARAHFAVAEAWDSGRISKPVEHRPPFADEVAGLLGLASGLAPVELDGAIAYLREVEDRVFIADQAHTGRLTPLDVLARDFQLSALAVAILFAIVAPRLRGDLARLYGILANDPGRALVDEYLLNQILGAGFAQQIARELDGDRPLRRYGLVRAGSGERPFTALTVDPLVVRYIAHQSPEGEPDQHLKVRLADRTLDALQLPRALIVKALRFLAAPRDQAAARVVVRGRTGSGRHSLLAALAARAGRGLGVIDLSTLPREASRAAPALEGALRRAMLRGLLPCVDGLELISSEDPDTKLQLATVLRNHPGAITIRLPTEAQVPLDPGYLLLDVPARNERQRGESWAIALDRHAIALPDTSELAARYRVGPGIIERVCAEVARRPDRPRDPAAWIRELDDAVRQHLENRLGTTANRITRLASWADIVLPEDVTDALLELTARVRHRKQVYETWGFDKSMTTSRGITALFQGSPGTGKTMVAGVIARDLGLELYRVDVSRITSKWIGETE